MAHYQYFVKGAKSGRGGGVFEFSYLAPDFPPGFQAGELFGGLFNGLGGAQQLVLGDQHWIVGVHPVRSLTTGARLKSSVRD